MNEANDFKFVRRIWNIVNNELNANYSVGNKTIYGTEVLKSNLFDYKDGNILLRGYKTIVGNNLKIVHHSLGVPKNNYRTTVGDAADLDLVMPMYNLLEYSSYYSDTTGSLWGFFRKMKQLMMMLILFMIMLLNLSSIKLNYGQMLKLMDQMES